MNYQMFLTCWLLVMLVFSTARMPGIYKKLNKTEGQLIGGLVGNTVKFIGIFVCLYFGGFYS